MIRSFFLTLFLCLALTAPGQAAEPSKGKSVPDTPAPAPVRSTPIAVEFEGTDSLGAKLAMRIRESFNSSNLFELTDKDKPKFRLLLSTKSEFADRPGVGSAYAVVWVFSQSDENMRYFITREVGLMTPDEVDGLAARLVERSDGLTTRYGYLLQ